VVFEGEDAGVRGDTADPISDRARQRPITQVGTREPVEPRTLPAFDEQLLPFRHLGFWSPRGGLWWAKRNARLAYARTNVIAEQVLRRDRTETMNLIYACSGGVQIAWRFLGASSSLLATGSPGAA
jgi:hypothetical protein